MEDPRAKDDDVHLPDEAIEDLSPEGDETAEVKGGKQVYQWWTKVEPQGPDG
jgi:hypothetical protein